MPWGTPTWKQQYFVYRILTRFKCYSLKKYFHFELNYDVPGVRGAWKKKLLSSWSRMRQTRRRKKQKKFILINFFWVKLEKFRLQKSFTQYSKRIIPGWIMKASLKRRKLFNGRWEKIKINISLILYLRSEGQVSAAMPKDTYLQQKQRNMSAETLRVH